MIIIENSWMKDNYSTYQMDNFYEMLSKGIVKSSGIMNYIQHIYIANHCTKGNSVLDMCCGRALMLPILNNYSPNISKYTGVDISDINIVEAKNFIKQFHIKFPYNFIECDVAKLSHYVKDKFDIILYTSAIEHLDRIFAISSLYQAFKVLKADGIFYLSTPRTKIESPRRLQYKVHIYEWDREELEEVLINVGFKIVKSIGLLPSNDDALLPIIKNKFGNNGVNWFIEMRNNIPKAFLDPIISSCFPEVAKEILYICKKNNPL